MEERTKRRLLSRGLLASDDWLNTCANNFRSSDEYAPGQDKLEKYIFEQWLEVNLIELRVSSVPPDLENQLKVTLNGRYTCQLMSVIDTGHSAYSQYQKIRKDDTENLAIDEADKFQQKWEPKSSRTLLLSLTDGAQEFCALEVQRIPTLSINLCPGCKAVIKGPVICRRGFIMLEKQSQIEILGGKVEDFLIPNAYENILGLNLGLPVNENARIATGQADDGLLNEDQGVAARNGNAPGGNRQAYPVPAQRAPPPPRAPVQRNRPVAPPQRAAGTWTNVNQNIPDMEDDFPDDDALLSIDLDNVMAMEVQEQNANFARNDPPTVRPQPVRPARPNNIDNSRRPPAFPPTTNNAPTSPTYDMDIDDELLSELANDIEEAAFSQPEPPTSVPKKITTQSNALGKLFTRPEDSSNKSSSSSAQPRKTIDSWFKPNRNTDTGNAKSKILGVAEVNLESPPRSVGASTSSRITSSTYSNSSTSSYTHPAQRLVTPVSQDSGYPEDGDDIICLEDEDFAPPFRPTVKVETASTPQRRPIEVAEDDVPKKLADVAEDITKGDYGQSKKVEVKVKIEKVVQSLNIKNEEWTMAVEISDDSAILEVSVSSDAITKIFGITPAEGGRRRKEAVKDPRVKEELKQAFRRLEKTLKTLDCIFEIVIRPGQKPCVVNIQH